MQPLAAQTRFQESTSPHRRHIACIPAGQQVSAQLKEKLHGDQSAAHSPPPPPPPDLGTADGETSPSIRLTPSLATPRLPICTSAADVSVTPSSGSPQGACEHSRPLRARSTEGNRKGEARGGEGGRGGADRTKGHSVAGENMRTDAHRLKGSVT